MRPLWEEWDAGKAASREHPLAGCNREANTASVLLSPQPFGLRVFGRFPALLVWARPQGYCRCAARLGKQSTTLQRPSWDFISASLGGTPSCIELLQESIERYLKGYLISRGWELRKTHSLSTLLDHAVHYDEEFKAHADLCENLTAQFWAQHYPGDDLSEVGEDYPQLRSQAAELIRLIKERLS